MIKRFAHFKGHFLLRSVRNWHGISCVFYVMSLVFGLDKHTDFMDNLCNSICLTASSVKLYFRLHLSNKRRSPSDFLKYLLLLWLLYIHKLIFISNFLPQSHSTKAPFLLFRPNIKQFKHYSFFPLVHYLVSMHGTHWITIVSKWSIYKTNRLGILLFDYQLWCFGIQRAYWVCVYSNIQLCIVLLNWFCGAIFQWTDIKVY